MTRIRWTICALLFFATTVNYMDRQVLSILAKTLEVRIGWTTIQYGYITAAFQASYAIGLLFAGRLIDRLGTKKGYAIAVGVWGSAAMAHAAAFSAFTFGVARSLLGLGESANFPAALKGLAEWFPKKERALAVGIFNSGANVGPILASFTVPPLAVAFGWQAAFIAIGALDFVTLAAWLSWYAKPTEHRHVSADELAHIESDPPDRAGSVPWGPLWRKKETWAFALAKALTDPVWWFYLFWFPRYLQETFGLTLQRLVWPTVIVYSICTMGSVGGGFFSTALLARGWRLNRARKTAMLFFCVAAIPVMYAPHAKNLWVVVGLIGLATAAHQGWSANLLTFPSDTFPRAAVGSVVGIGGLFGSVAGVLLQVATGYIVQWTHSYVPLFVIGGSAYLVAWTVLNGLSPRLEPAQLD
jgi:ACS family hexuronate transporter-like MFS transporter